MILATLIAEDNTGALKTVGDPAPLSESKALFRQISDDGGRGFTRLLLLSTRGLEKRRKFKPLAEAESEPREKPKPKPKAKAKPKED